LQDNAPIHNAEIVSKCFAKEGVDRYESFPPYSPDLNLIEHVWAYLAYALTGRNISTRDSLLHALRDEWEKYSEWLCARLYATWHARLEAVIAAEGGHTKY
jgi:transposase